MYFLLKIFAGLACVSLLSPPPRADFMHFLTVQVNDSVMAKAFVDGSRSGSQFTLDLDSLTWGTYSFQMVVQYCGGPPQVQFIEIWDGEIKAGIWKPEQTLNLNPTQFVMFNRWGEPSDLYTMLRGNTGEKKLRFVMVQQWRRENGHERIELGDVVF